MIGTNDRILSQSPPRPFKAIARGGAFIVGVGGIVGSFIGLGTFLILLATEVLPRAHTPLLGDTRATATAYICIAGAVAFVFNWVAAASAWRRILLYRTGRRATGTVERVSVKGEGDVRTLTMYWKLQASGGQAHAMRTALKLPRGAKPPAHPTAGDQFPALYPDGRSGAAQPAGLLGLKRFWVLSDEIQPPYGFTAFKIIGLSLGVILLGLALTGLTVNRTLDPGYLQSWTWIVSAAAAVLCVPTWFALRRWGPWLPGQSWVWLGGAFFALCMGAMGLVSGLNVWLVDTPPKTVNAEIMHMDEEYFPEFHFAAYVRSWRPGHVKERIPLYWRQGLSAQPGEVLVLEINEGAFGWPTVGKVKRSR